jgi:hypothetical protein
LRIIYGSFRVLIVNIELGGAPPPTGPMAGRGCDRPRRRLPERQPHRGDRLLLVDDDLLRDPPQLLMRPWRSSVCAMSIAP